MFAGVGTLEQRCFSAGEATGVVATLVTTKSVLNYFLELKKHYWSFWLCSLNFKESFLFLSAGAILYLLMDLLNNLLCVGLCRFDFSKGLLWVHTHPSQSTAAPGISAQGGIRMSSDWNKVEPFSSPGAYGTPFYHFPDGILWGISEWQLILAFYPETQRHDSLHSLTCVLPTTLTVQVMCPKEAQILQGSWDSPLVFPTIQRDEMNSPGKTPA